MDPWNREDICMAYTGVFCNLNLEDCLRSGVLCLRLIEDNIDSALNCIGYAGKGIVEYQDYGGKEVEVHYLLWDMIHWASSYYPDPVNLMVISKKLPNHQEFSRVLHALELRHCNVLLVQPDDDVALESLFQSADSIKNCITLLNGEKPMDQTIQDVDDTCSASSRSWETDTDYEDTIDDEALELLCLAQGKQSGL